MFWFFNCAKLQNKFKLSIVNYQLFITFALMMIQLPKEFIHTTKALMGDERFERYLHSFEEELPVSIRLNPMKMQGKGCQACALVSSCLLSSKAS